MRLIFWIILTLLSSEGTFSQEQQTAKTQVLLLGTFHFEPSEVDLYKNKSLDILGDKRQSEITEVVNLLTHFNPDRICIEYARDSQLEVDSLYKAYLIDQYVRDKSEVDQLGFKLAKEMGHESVECINYYGTFDQDSVFSYASSNGFEKNLEDIGVWGNSFIEEVNTNLENLSINDFLIYLNSDSTLKRNASYYTDHLIRIGKDETYIGTELVADWYETNLHIYTNLVPAIENDEKVIVIFGQGHIPILTHLLQSNPNITLIEAEEYLGR